jgi:hypothetical protein
VITPVSEDVKICRKIDTVVALLFAALCSVNTTMT